MEEVKKELLAFCRKWIEDKIEVTSTAMKMAQDSANSEEKNSAGDKFETGRAMSMIERDMHAKQLSECLKQQALLGKIEADKSHMRVEQGAFVVTEEASYYISISIGSITVNETTCFAISPDTPIAKLLWGKKQGEHFSRNGKNFTIKQVC